MRAQALAVAALRRIGTRWLPFADVATAELPLGRLFRLSLFQVSVGMAAAITAGTLNRVVIVELGVSASLMSIMIALPVLAAPFRALIGFRSDVHRSALGWRRVPYLWMGTMLQFGGFAIMPFALILLQGDKDGSMLPGTIGAALAFLLVGVGMHMSQTAGLALATDLATPKQLPRLVAMLYVMLLVGMGVSALLLGVALTDFSHTRLVQVIQGAALITVVLNVIAMWKQEPRNPERFYLPPEPTPSFRQQWRSFAGQPRVRRLLIAVGIGTAGFTMQDILLEPYGGEILGLSVAATTLLTALFAAGSVLAYALCARILDEEGDPLRPAAYGAVVGIWGFAAVIFASPLESPSLFRLGTLGIGFGAGLFAVGTLVAAMRVDREGEAGLAVGAWGAVQMTAAGMAMATGGVLRDVVGHLADAGRLGVALTDPATGYSAVYHLEIFFLFLALVSIGPLVQPLRRARRRSTREARFGLAELPN